MMVKIKMMDQKIHEEMFDFDRGYFSGCDYKRNHRNVYLVRFCVVRKIFGKKHSASRVVLRNERKKKR